MGKCHGRVGDTRHYEWCRTVGSWCGTRQYAGGKTVDVWYGTGHRTVGVRHEPPPNYSSLQLLLLLLLLAWVQLVIIKQNINVYISIRNNES